MVAYKIEQISAHRVRTSSQKLDNVSAMECGSPMCKITKSGSLYSLNINDYKEPHRMLI